MLSGAKEDHIVFVLRADSSFIYVSETQGIIFYKKMMIAIQHNASCPGLQYVRRGRLGMDAHFVHSLQNFVNLSL